MQPRPELPTSDVPAVTDDVGATSSAAELLGTKDALPAPAARDGEALPFRTLATDRSGATGARRATVLEAFFSTLRLGLAALVFYAVFFHLSVVRGSSMSPGIEDGDRILVEPWSYVLSEAERGDIVVLQYPLDPSVDYIKRIIGLPGDRVTLADGHVWVNGELLNEPYVTDADRSSYLSVVVEQGNYFVLGDNRPRSSDSREFGLVPAEYVRGRVDMRLWPPSRAGWIR